MCSLAVMIVGATVAAADGVCVIGMYVGKVGGWWVGRSITRLKALS